MCGNARWRFVQRRSPARGRRILHELEAVIEIDRIGPSYANGFADRLIERGRFLRKADPRAIEHALEMITKPKVIPEIRSTPVLLRAGEVAFQSQLITQLRDECQEVPIDMGIVLEPILQNRLAATGIAKLHEDIR